jgi:hypothetical protein
MEAPRQAVAPTSLSMSSRSKSFSKSKRDLDFVVPSNWFESDPTSPGAARVEVALKMDVFSIYRTRSGCSNSSRLSVNSSRSLCQVGVEASGFLESTRWLLKPPKPLATRIQEPKTKVVPSSSMALVKLRDAIEFSGGCSMNTSAWRTSYQCFTATPTEGYP